MDFAWLVAKLAEGSPDAATKRELHGVVRSIRRRYGYSEKEKEAVVLEMIRTGAASATDIICETGINQFAVSKITKDLEKRGLIRVNKVPPPGSKGGRPSLLYFPVE